MKKLLIVLGACFFLYLRCPAVAEQAVQEKLPVNTLKVGIDAGRNTVRGVSEITLPPGRTWEIERSGLTILKASINNHPFQPEKDGTLLTVETGAAADTVRIEFEAVYPSAPLTDKDKNPGVVQGGSITEDFIYLPSGWYPAVRGRSLHRLEAMVPPGFEAVSEADEVAVSDRPEGRVFSFSFPHPVGGLTLVAGKYAVARETAGGITVSTYFFPADEGLSKAYLEQARRFLAMYQDMLGPYPFKRFAVVENVFPTGYSLPSFTLLGADVVRLPFISETSLGHEVLHQWFGSLVGIDSSRGNWAEGLTTYLADHYYELQKGKGADYRKQMLISFQSYVNAGNGAPLTAFQGRSDWASRSIGYGKAAMVFHMLKSLTGEDMFQASLRSLVKRFAFRQASWDDIRAIFDETTGKDLGWFFKQWIEGKGAPEIEVRNVLSQYRGARAVVTFDIVQKGGPLRMMVPILLRLKNTEVRMSVEIQKEKTPVSIEAEDVPLELVVDDRYDIFRKLSAPEFPAVAARLMGAQKRIFVVPSGREKEYEPITAVLKKEEYVVKDDAAVAYEDLAGASLVVDADSTLAKRFFAGVEVPAADFSMSVRENPFGRGVVALIRARSAEDIPSYLRRVSHYGKYGQLVFEGGKNSVKSVAGSDLGIRTGLSAQVAGVEIQKVVSLDDVLARAAEKDIVYVGEVHDRFEHHRVQFEAIRSLHKAGKKVAIGMEMFQRPFQQALDDYISGAIDERTFLKKSEYFKRWGFDYNLYREIMLYAREFKIPVVALNIKKEVVSKVSKEGLNALSADDLKEVPADMDLTDSAYRDRLRAFFERHQESGERNFDFFYQAQVLWDESMAHNLDRFIRENPDYKVVVVAGVGHMAYGSGIPKRTHRLNGRPYTVILNTDDVESQIADFVLFPEPIRHNESPRLGVMLKDEDKKVKISGFSPHSSAEKAGLKTDDLILSMDGAPVESVEDMKIILMDKKKGDSVEVKALRKRFLFGDEVKEFKITF